MLTNIDFSKLKLNFNNNEKINFKKLLNLLFIFIQSLSEKFSALSGMNYLKASQPKQEGIT